MKKPIPRKAPPKRAVETNANRTFHGLRDVLFDEIDTLRGPNPDPRRAMAVSSLAKQITNTVMAEVTVAKETKAIQDKGGDVQVGTLVLGGPVSAASVGSPAKVH